VERTVTVQTVSEDKAYFRSTPRTTARLRVRRVATDGSSGQIASVEAVVVTDINGNPRDLTAVPYWEENIIRPEFEDPSGSYGWSYDLVVPNDLGFAERAVESSVVGFRRWQDFDAETNEAVLLKAGDYRYHHLSDGTDVYPLQPTTQYEFKLFIAEDGKDRREVTIIFKTMPNPTIVFPPIYMEGNGALNEASTLAVTAYSTVKSSNFAYYFYAKRDNSDGNFLESICLGACAGDSYVEFSLGISGTYTIVAVLTDAAGQAVLHIAENSVKVPVATSITGNDIETHIAELEEYYKIGSDEKIAALSTYVSYAIKVAAGSIEESDVTFQAAETSESRTEFLAKGLRYMAQVSKLSIPFRGQNLQLAQIGCVYSTMREEEGVALDDADLSYLVDVFYYAMTNPPPTITYDEDVIKQLTCIGNGTQELLDNSQRRSVGSRRRLLQEFQERPYQEVRLQFFEAYWKTIIFYETRGKGCGYESNPLYTKLPEDLGAIAGAPGAFSSFRVNVVCTKDQIPTWFNSSSSDGGFGGSIGVCPSAFEDLPDDGSRERALIIAYGFEPPYPRESGVQNDPDELLSAGVARVGVYRMSESGTELEDVIGSALYSGCFTFELPTDPEERNNILKFSATKFNGLKQYDEEMPYLGGYEENSGVVDLSSLELTDGNETVRFSTAQTGLFASTFVSGFRAEVPTPEVSRGPSGEDGGPGGVGAVAITGIVIGSLLFLLLLLLVLFLFFVRLPASAAPLAAAPAPVPIYVDRDVYGRASMFDLEEVGGDDDGEDMEEYE